MSSQPDDLVPVTHVVRGRAVRPAADAQATGQLLVPGIELDDLVWRRDEPFPGLSLSHDEIIDFLVETGKALGREDNPHLPGALAALARVNSLPRKALETSYSSLSLLFGRDLLNFELDQGLGGSAATWRRVDGPPGRAFDVRPFPSRMVHIMAGNGPANASLAIIRTALARGTSLLKLPSNDPFSAPAILRTMADIDAGHPLVRSFSAAYWRGGDTAVESNLYRPQFFDKIIAWGGEGAIRNVVAYLGPGLELISFDPKTSISLIGVEAHAGADQLADVARHAARDVNFQEGCTSSRFQFVEGTIAQVDAYCAELAGCLRGDPDLASGQYKPTPLDIRAEVDGLRLLAPEYRVWGGYDGSGLVIRSDEPVEFHPTARTVNVVRVDALTEALRHVTVATQTVGVYPPARKAELRDSLACRGGVDRVVDLGRATLFENGGLGSPHDAFYPLARFVRWIYSDVVPQDVALDA